MSVAFCLILTTSIIEATGKVNSQNWTQNWRNYIWAKKCSDYRKASQKRQQLTGFSFAVRLEWLGNWQHQPFPVAVAVQAPSEIIEFKGALTEQYVCQQLKTIEDLGIFYYANDRGACEVDFVVDTGEQIIPVEVKAEVNLRAKSLKTYQEKFLPEISVRTSMADFKKKKIGLLTCRCMRLKRS